MYIYVMLRNMEHAYVLWPQVTQKKKKKKPKKKKNKKKKNQQQSII
jgi:hypothetical protein